MARVRPCAIGQHANLRHPLTLVSTNHNIRQYVGDVNHVEGEQASIGKWVIADRHPFAGAKIVQLSLAMLLCGVSVPTANGQKPILGLSVIFIS